MANNKIAFNLDDRKKRILTIAGVAAVIVIFASFLLSLSDGEEEQQKNNSSETIELEQNVDTNKVPASVRYDFDNESAEQGELSQGSLSDMLNDNDLSQTQDATIDSSQGEIDQAPVATTNQDDTLAPGIETTQIAKAYLYCDEFSSKAQAEEAKAKIAFLGVISNVDSYNNKLSLKIGPFDNRDKARAKFQDLNSKGLVGTCTLIDE